MRYELTQRHGPKRRIRWRWLCALWARVYRRWLDDGEHVEAVIGWRTALVSKPGRRGVMSPCFWIFD